MGLDTQNDVHQYEKNKITTQAMIDNAESMICRFFPDAKKVGKELQVGNAYYNLENHAWNDFSDPNASKERHGPVSFIGHITGNNQGSYFYVLRDMFGFSESKITLDVCTKKANERNKLINEDKQRALDTQRKALNWWNKCSKINPNSIQGEYLASRRVGIEGKELMRAGTLKYGDKQETTAIIFPIKDMSGSVKGIFAIGINSDDPKNPLIAGEKRKLRYGRQANGTVNPTMFGNYTSNSKLIICEGEIDALTIYQKYLGSENFPFKDAVVWSCHGIDNFVKLNLPEGIKNDDIIIVFDNDTYNNLNKKIKIEENISNIKKSFDGATFVFPPKGYKDYNDYLCDKKIGNEALEQSAIIDAEYEKIEKENISVNIEESVDFIENKVSNTIDKNQIISPNPKEFQPINKNNNWFDEWYYSVPKRKFINVATNEELGKEDFDILYFDYNSKASDYCLQNGIKKVRGEKCFDNTYDKLILQEGFWYFNTNTENEVTNSFSGLEFLKKPLKTSHLVEGLFSTGNVINFHGRTGSGKSFILIDLLLSIANGHDQWCNRKIENGLVVFCVGEGQDGFKKRVKGWFDAKGKQKNEFKAHFYLDLFTLTEKKSLDKFKKYLRDLPEKPKAVVFDTMTKYFDGDINSAQDTSKFIKILYELALEFDLAIFFSCHTGHQGQREKGASNLRDDVDASFFISNNRDGITMEAKKIKDGDCNQRFYFKFKSHEITDWDDGTSSNITSIIVPCRANEYTKNERTNKNPKPSKIDNKRDDNNFTEILKIAQEVITNDPLVRRELDGEEVILSGALFKVLSEKQSIKIPDKDKNGIMKALGCEKVKTTKNPHTGSSDTAYKKVKNT